MTNHVFSFLLCISIIAGCKGVVDKPADPPQKFCISDTLMKIVTIDTVKLLNVENELKLIGKISFDEEQVVKVYPLISGIVTEVKVSLGDYVKKGQILALIKSIESAGTENDLVTARSNLEITRKNLQATEDMYKSGISSEKEYITAQKDNQKAESELKKIENIIKINGNNSSADYIVRAPSAGYVVERLINPNMQLRSDNSNNMFTISDLGHVWVIANVYESDIAKVKLSQEVTVQTIAYPDKSFQGKVDKLNNVLDPDNKTMKIRVELKNQDFLLKPEMFADVTVKYSSKDKMMMVPSKALVFDKSKDFVLVYNNKCDVKTKEVQVFSTVGEKTYISSGLKPGDRVITNSQLLIYDVLNN
jgi:membrane fusion protein, heavy metal efflux system